MGVTFSENVLSVVWCLSSQVCIQIWNPTTQSPKIIVLFSCFSDIQDLAYYEKLTFNLIKNSNDNNKWTWQRQVSFWKTCFIRAHRISKTGVHGNIKATGYKGILCDFHGHHLGWMANENSRERDRYEVDSFDTDRKTFSLSSVNCYLLHSLLSCFLPAPALSRFPKKEPVMKNN